MTNPDRDLKFIEEIMSQFLKEISESDKPESRADTCADFVDMCLSQMAQGNGSIARRVLISTMATLAHNMMVYKDTAFSRPD